MSIATIDDVIEQLGRHIDLCRAQDSRLGYFPALYRKVTIAVAEGIQRGVFEDGERMARLDVLFAKRYLDAADAWHGSQPCTRSWRVAFESAERWPPVVLQHLLLGINAHINLDLGIAAAQTAPKADLAALGNDFNQINAILAGLVKDVKDDLCRVWPLLHFYERIVGNLDDRMINFSMEKARNAAWDVAERLAPLEPADWQPHIDAVDLRTATLGRVIATPPIRTRLLLLGVRIGERGSVREIIDLLC